MDSPITGEELRMVMREAPSSVTVVTVIDRGASGVARGITIGSFTSVSLKPPLVSFNVDHEAAAHGALSEAEHFAVHVLAEDQAALAVRFAAKDLSGAELFEAVPHARDAHGTPLLEGAVAVLHCRPWAAFEAEGDTVFVGEVMATDVHGGRALLYHRGAYHGVGSAVKSSRLGPVKRASSETS